MTAQMQAMADAFDRRDATALIRGVAANASGGPSDAEVAAATADLFSRNDPHMLAVIARTIPTLWDVTRRDLAATRIPVLAIDGEFDVPNLEAARRMKGIVRDLQVIVVPGTNHQTSVRLAAPPIVAFLDAHQDR
jgi:pimeloyl-ACP methyl ester carboxylesterase